MGGRRARRRAIRRTCRLPSSGRTTRAGSWRNSSAQPDLVVKSEAYTMPAHGQDVWFKPLTDDPAHGGALGSRGGDAAGDVGGPQDHAPRARAICGRTKPARDGQSVASGPGLLMEWAVGKNYDIYRPNTGKLLLPGSRDLGGNCIFTRSAKRFAIMPSWRVYLYPKGEVPKYRTRLRLFARIREPGRGLDIPPNTVAETSGIHVLRSPARLENFQPHMHCAARRCRWKRSCRMAPCRC